MRHCPSVPSPLRPVSLPSRSHNGSKFRDSVPLRHDFHRSTLSIGLLHGLVLPSRSHNGRKSRDSVPLRHGFHRSTLSIGLLHGLVLPSRFHNGSKFRDSVPLRHGFHRGTLSIGLLCGLALPSRFHNGRKSRDSVPLRNRIPLGPCHRLSHHTPYPSSTFRRCAVFPRFRLTYTLSFFHLPKVCSIPAFSSHLPKVCGVATSSRAPCISVFPAAARFPPSEGVQYSRIFVSPSEGAWSRHCFESALCPCFSSRLAFPTFRRCADFPCFRLTFRRCVESPHLRERSVSVFLLPPWHSHLPKVRRFPSFSSHLPKVRGVVTASRTPCVRVSSRLAFPTFRRCADFPCFRLTFRRCVESPHLRERPVSVFLLRPCISHLPKVCKIPPFSSHLPKVRGVATSSRAPCIRVSPVTVHFPPSEGAQISLVFVSPSEGARSRHSFESALCPCFSSRLAFPTFRRCAVSGAADATILKRPDALCRKTSIAITRILVFLPLFNRK